MRLMRAEVSGPCQHGDRPNCIPPPERSLGRLVKETGDSRIRLERGFRQVPRQAVRVIGEHCCQRSMSLLTFAGR